ncbi:hypothetical protein EWI61_04310 [Methylolobus aquaticus]|nr:hypothetical protein EWI61_04310 [Methylolobus aquaticus]
MSDETKKPSGPDWKVNPELFDDYDIREERKPTPESEAYYQSLMAMTGGLDDDDESVTTDHA